ncbi:hypothetical protein DLAC_07281 [Tieghemostelium lacteum]|uniref:Uncharacterized protein n=1 Tax=Tieghemostelium lacteum TaxID=361077 RepID=A0A151ZC45_TIELA|nr:hypothetical protein DLAC_07281 [Tieghemostelium lacteum]|eukprot:KYQ91522.1 hypothetical protein DLAC_07281 [Tieghemostelium lacteum]
MIIQEIIKGNLMCSNGTTRAEACSSILKLSGLEQYKELLESSGNQIVCQLQVNRLQDKIVALFRLCMDQLVTIKKLVQSNYGKYISFQRSNEQLAEYFKVVGLCFQISKCQILFTKESYGKSFCKVFSIILSDQLQNHKCSADLRELIHLIVRLFRNCPDAIKMVMEFKCFTKVNSYNKKVIKMKNNLMHFPITDSSTFTQNYLGSLIEIINMVVEWDVRHRYLDSICCGYIYPWSVQYGVCQNDHYPELTKQIFILTNHIAKNRVNRVPMLLNFILNVPHGNITSSITLMDILVSTKSHCYSLIGFGGVQIVSKIISMESTPNEDLEKSLKFLLKIFNLIRSDSNIELTSKSTTLDSVVSLDKDVVQLNFIQRFFSSGSKNTNKSQQQLFSNEISSEIDNYDISQLVHLPGFKLLFQVLFNILGKSDQITKLSIELIILFANEISFNFILDKYLEVSSKKCVKTRDNLSVQLDIFINNANINKYSYDSSKLSIVLYHIINDCQKVSYVDSRKYYTLSEKWLKPIEKKTLVKEMLSQECKIEDTAGQSLLKSILSTISNNKEFSDDLSITLRDKVTKIIEQIETSSSNDIDQYFQQLIYIMKQIEVIENTSNVYKQSMKSIKDVLKSFSTKSQYFKVNNMKVEEPKYEDKCKRFLLLLNKK